MTSVIIDAEAWLIEQPRPVNAISRISWPCSSIPIEADDLIATLTRKWCQASPAHRVVIVTSDKDLMQLVGERVKTWDTMSDKIYGPLEVEVPNESTVRKLTRRLGAEVVEAGAEAEVQPWARAPS